MWKALSTDTVFKRSVKFGFVTEEDKDLVQRFKVTKFPTIIMLRGEKGTQQEKYTGALNYREIAAWANLHSESGMGDQVHSAAGKQEESIEEAKPWLIQEVPELTKASQGDICFKGTGLCVIYLKDGQLSQEETDMLTQQSKKFTSQLSGRGTTFKWMWMDLSIETAFKDLFNAQALPSAVVFNPHKRLRFASLEEGEKATPETFAKIMDKVLGGDARFKVVPGQKLPAFADRKPAAKGKKEL